MSYKEKLALAASFRAGTALDSEFPDSHPSIRATKESAYLPGGEKRSLVPLRPPGEGDLSHLNPHPKNGRKAR